jgi:hypothetical protein
VIHSALSTKLSDHIRNFTELKASSPSKSNTSILHFADWRKLKPLFSLMKFTNALHSTTPTALYGAAVDV